MCATQPDPEPFSRAELMERLGGDEELFTDVVRLFLADCPERLAAIEHAVELRDAELIRTSAHALKGAAGTLAAHGLFAAAQTLERLGGEGRLEPVDGAWRALTAEAEGLMGAFRQISPAA